MKKFKLISSETATSYLKKRTSFLRLEPTQKASLGAVPPDSAGGQIGRNDII